MYLSAGVGQAANSGFLERLNTASCIVNIEILISAFRTDIYVFFILNFGCTCLNKNFFL